MLFFSCTDFFLPKFQKATARFTSLNGSGNRAPLPLFFYVPLKVVEGGGRIVYHDIRGLKWSQKGPLKILLLQGGKILGQTIKYLTDRMRQPTREISPCVCVCPCLCGGDEQGALVSMW